MNKLFYNAAATDSAGDPTGVVLKAIGDMEAGMLTKAESEAIAAKAAGDAVAPLQGDITALKTQVNAIDEKAGKRSGRCNGRYAIRNSYIFQQA